MLCILDININNCYGNSQLEERLTPIWRTSFSLLSWYLLATLSAIIYFNHNESQYL